MAQVRRTLKSLGFEPFGKDILVMDPAMVYHDEAVKKLPASLACLSDLPGSDVGSLAANGRRVHVHWRYLRYRQGLRRKGMRA